MKLDDVFLPFRLTGASISVIVDHDNHRYVISGRTGRSLAMVRCSLDGEESLVPCNDPRGVSNLDPRWDQVVFDGFTWSELLHNSFPVMVDNVVDLLKEMESWPRSIVSKEHFLGAVDRALLGYGLVDIKTLLTDIDVEASHRFMVYDLAHFVAWLRVQGGDLSLSCGDQALAATCSMKDFDLICLCSYVNSQKGLPTTEYGGWYDWHFRTP